MATVTIAAHATTGRTVPATGPADPAGPANGLAAYGGLYNNTPQTIALTIGTTSQIPLAIAMPVSNVTVGTNTLTVNQSGVYEINFFTTASAALGAAVTVLVRRNGVALPETVVTRLLAVNVGTVFSGSIITNLNAGDVIDLATRALLALGLTFGGGVNATLTVKKISS